MSAALANYAASRLGEKAAYLELNGSGEIGLWKEAREKGYFTDLSVHYYPNFKKEEIPVILNRDYDRIIMDFGENYAGFREELLRCDRKVFLLSLNFWQKPAAQKLAGALQGERWAGIRPLYAGTGAQEPVKREIEKEYGIRVSELPFIKDPRRIRTEEFACMDLVLGRSVAKTKRKKMRIPFYRTK